MTFGTNEVLDIPKQGGDRAKAILSLYRRQLKSKAKFVGQFDMHGRKDQKVPVHSGSAIHPLTGSV